MMNIMLIVGMIMMLCVPLVNAIQTDKIYVGETGIIGGVSTYDYDAQKGDGYIVWTRALDLMDSGGNLIPDGDVISAGGLHDPSWIMIQEISSGTTWNLTADYDAGFRTGNYYYHAGSVSIHGKKVLYELVWGTSNWERTLYMYNITSDETWQIPHGTLSTYTSGYEHQIFGDWIYFSHYGGGGRQIYVYNYETGEGRRIDGGATSNTGFGINEDLMWFSDTTGTPDILKIYGLDTGKLTQIDGTNIGATIYASSKSSYDGRYLGLSLLIGTDYDSYIIDLEGMNITDEGGDVLIYWENIAEENIIEVDTENSYNSYAPFTDGRYAIYNYVGNNLDIMIYDIDEDRKIYFVASSNYEGLSDFTGSTILYNTNINSFTHNNDATDDFDIYRSVSDTEAISSTFINAVPVIIILVFVFFVVGAFAFMFRNDGYGGMI